ncbi:hypothetical protein BHE90_002277 [Fusarium euwallaceae]|uniref:FAD dependent oxidoreductase domain-containing protein n=1 Tax=Fusarium euwallaceae TaxID=1147111 RepID=A0A430M5C6_9HYPO|nr:hypothetical protein BHE90_002277 [Fusarium euwallaceae]
MGYSSDRLPRVGEIPDRPSMFIMGGFTGHGMPQVFLCARGMADVVLGNKEFNDAGIPRLFQESKERLSDSRNRILELYQEPLEDFQSKL